MSTSGSKDEFGREIQEEFLTHRGQEQSVDNTVNTADINNIYGEYEEADAPDEDELILSDKAGEVVIWEGFRDSLSPKTGCCRTPVITISEIDTQPAKIMKTIYHMLQSLNPEHNIDCLSNEISNCYNILCYVVHHNLIEESVILAVADQLLRNRHEILHKMSMLSVGVNTGKSDMKFSEVFDLQSIRTPDYIHRDDNTMTCIIIETTVSTDKQKSYMQKGKIEEGYESKYFAEMELISNLGYKVSYIVLHFDIRDIFNEEYKNDIELLSRLLGVELNQSRLLGLELIRRCFASLNEKFSTLLKPYFSKLFIDEFIPNYAPSTVTKFLEADVNIEGPQFQRLSVSNNVYNRISNSWPRLLRMVDMLVPDYYSLSLDISTNKLTFNLDERGLHSDIWNALIVDNDKKKLLSMLKITVLNTKIIEMGGKIEYFSKTRRFVPSSLDLNFTLSLHEDTVLVESADELPDYQHYLTVNHYLDQGYRHQHEDYDGLVEDIIEPIFWMDEPRFNEYTSKLKFKKPFVCNVLKTSDFPSFVKDYITDYSSINSMVNEPKNILHQKTAFCYPLINPNSCEYISYKEKDYNFLEDLLKKVSTPFTSLVISKVLEPNFEFGSRPSEPPARIKKIQNDISGIQRLIHKSQITNKKDGKIMKANEIEECTSYLKDLKDLRRLLREEKTKSSYKGGKLSVIRLPTKNKKSESGLGHMFQSEMSHFKNKGEISNYKGVGRFDYATLLSEYETLKNDLLSPAKLQCPDKLYDEYVAEDAALLQQLKRDTIDLNHNDYEFMRNTCLYASCAMISRFCYTLMYFSQTSISSDYVFCDNLGLTKTLLICKGGKKIFRTKKSKFYKMFYPTYSSAVNWINRVGFNSSFKVHVVQNEFVVETPWMLMDETVLADGMTFLSRNCGFTLMNKNISTSLDESLRLCFLNVMLSLNNRRQTEELMHSVRYITVNCIASISSIDKMLPSLSGFNYDFFQCYLRESLVVRFLDFSTKLKDFHDNCPKNPDDWLLDNPVPHLFDPGVVLTSAEQLTLVIYCTFLMSKAPVTQSLEQVKNLKGMLSTHDTHHKLGFHSYEDDYNKNTTSIGDKDESKKYWEGLFQNDFNYDPKYVYMLGGFCADYLSSLTTMGDLQVQWNRILENEWNSFANTSGLRGERTDKNFYGKKGYYIVYSEILKNESILTKVTELLKSDISDDDKRRNLKKLNENFKTKLNKVDLTECVFHVVDKRQRGGSREIFVMSLYTKLYQQPIEKIAAHLCKLIPNELISVPSNRRLSNIHTTVHERFKSSELQQYNITFDCRRWAPHSVVSKFIDFVLGMRRFLPKSLLVHLLFVFENMITKKKIFTKKYVYEIMHKNKKLNSLVTEHLSYDEVTDSYYFMPRYSWMMGIYNYFSSLLHVVNQLHISYICNNVSIRVLKTELNLHMNAHSDDSAGKIMCDSELTMRKTFFVYEMLLKSCNHMLSDKKCNISKTYYEFLSILYIGERLLTLLPKFVGSFNFHPSDKGYCVDITDAYSKCIEVLTNGATFEQAYIAMKISVYSMWRFYFGKDIPRMFYSLPPQLCGVPDAHPMNVLLSGSDADLVRLKLFSKNFNFKTIILLAKLLNGFENLEDSFITPLSAVPQIIPSKELLGLSSMISNDDEELNWIIKNLNLNNTALSAMSYLNKLKDKNFVAAMQDETLSRRISRAYYFRNSDCISTSYGHMSYKSIKSLLSLYYCVSNNLDIDMDIDLDKEVVEEVININTSVDDFIGVEFFEILNSEVLTLNLAMSTISYTPAQVEDRVKTIKPISFNIQRMITPISGKFKPDLLTMWIKFPNYRWMLPPGNYNNLKNMVEGFLNERSIDLEDCEINWLNKLLKKFKGKYLKEYFMYSNMPASDRTINTYKDVLSMLTHNSFKDKSITGIISPYNRTMNTTFEEIMHDFMTPQIRKALNIMDFMSGALNDQKIFGFVSKLLVNGTDKIGFDGLMEVVDKIAKEYEDNIAVSYFIVPNAKAIKSYMNKEAYNIGSSLERSYFHCFTRRQHLVGNIWVGKGSLYINTPNLKMCFQLENQMIKNVIVDRKSYVLNRQETAYVEYVMANAKLPSLRNSLMIPDQSKWTSIGFGVNDKGDFEIGQQRYLISVITSTDIQKMPDRVLSNIPLSETSVLPRLKYKVINKTMERDKEYNIHTFDLPSRGILHSLQEMLNNDYNQQLMAREGGEAKTYLEYLVGLSTQTDFYVDFKNMYTHYDLSELYKIMRWGQHNEKINFDRLRIRDKYYPGQEGGMLGLLIDYKSSNPNFLFNPKPLVTPELMYLKSTQPEAFMSNLITNLKEKYDSLYTNIDKELIAKSLHKIIGYKDEVGFENDIVSVLTQWGYIGVMGSLSELKFVKNVDSFKSFNFSKAVINHSQSGVFLKNILDCLFHAWDETKVYEIFTNYGSEQNYTTTMFWNNMKSYLFVNILRFYKGLTSHFHMSLKVSLIWFDDILNHSFSDENFRNVLNGKLSESYLLNTLPINPSNSYDWVIAINSLISTILTRNSKKININKNKKFFRLPDDAPNFLTLMGMLTTDQRMLSLRNMSHFGTLDDKFYKTLCGEKIIETKKGLVCLDILPSVKVLPKVNINEMCFFEDQLSEDVFDTDEWEEINLELASNDFDQETVESMINDIKENLGGIYKEEDAEYKVVKYKNTYRKLKIRQVNFLNMIGDEEIDFNFIRQVGSNLMILTDIIPKSLACVSSDVVTFYRINRMPNYYNAIISPRHIVMILITKDQAVKDSIKEVISCNQLDKGLLVRELFIRPYKAYYNEVRKFVDDKQNLSIAETYEEMLSAAEDMRQARERDNAQIENKEQTIKLMEEEGVEYEPESLSQFILPKDYPVLATDMKTLISSHLKNVMNVEQLQSNIKQVIEKPRESSFYECAFEVPEIFGTGRPKYSEIKNRSLKDPRLRAEIDSLSSNLTDLILSGTLTISKKVSKKMKVQMKLWKVFVKNSSINRNNKKYLLDLVTLIVNDGTTVVDSIHDKVWENIIDKVGEIVVDEEDEEDIEGVYDRDAGQGNLLYRMHAVA